MNTAQFDSFTMAYIECALWSSRDDHDKLMGGVYTVDDLAPEALARIIEDCVAFKGSFGKLINSDLERAGNDFWHTRNGHGVGFWDGDWDYALVLDEATTIINVGDHLTAMSKAYGAIDLYVGDDDLIYCQCANSTLPA